MAVAANSNQSIITAAAHMQPLVSGTVLYPGNRCSLWQPVATVSATGAPVPVPIVAMPELPKESIIANTDFTTTSIIAKRRLSSKKRRLQHQTGSTGSDISTTESTSPGSSNNASPAIICTPREKMDASDPFGQHEEAVTAAASSSQSKMEAVPAHTATTTAAGGGSGQFIPVTASHPAATVSNLMHSQIHNPAVLSQLQQGLNYRFLQEQSLLQQQQQQQQQQAASTVGIQAPPTSRVEHPQPHMLNPQRAPSNSKRSAFSGSSGFKWCAAHIITAKRIQQHKQHQSSGSPFQIYTKTSHPKPHPQAPPTTSSSFQSPPNHHHQHHQQQQHPSHAPSSRPSSLSSSTSCPLPHVTHPCSTSITSGGPPPMPQYALMQYSIPPNHPVAVTAATAAAPSMPPGYLALPYSSLQDLQLMQQSQAMMAAAGPTHIQLNAAGGIPIIKPVNVAASSVIGLNQGGGCGGGGGVQVVGGVPMQQAQLAQLALAHGIPAHATAITGVVPSSVDPSAGGFPIVNSCVPFHAGVMAAPWVK